MVFEFLKRKIQALAAEAVPSEPPPVAAASEGYEERRARAEALHEQGQTAEAVALLEDLAAELAGEGTFPLAVALRHQISAWSAGPPAAQTAAHDAEAMARLRKATGTFPRVGGRAAPPIPEGLERSRFFADMTSEEIAGFIASTERKTFREGELVLQEGKPGRDLYIVTRGLLRVETRTEPGKVLRMGVLTMGDVFGEVAFLTGRPRTATVVAETAAECLEIGEEAWAALGRFPRVRKVLEEVHEERARLTADAIVEDLRRRREGKRRS